MTRYKTLLAAILVAAAMSAAWLAWPKAERSVSEKAPDARALAAQSPLPVPEKPVTKTAITAQSAHAFSAEDGELLDKLRSRFRDRIHIKHAQIKLIEQLLAYLKEKYPERWAELAAAFIGELFPDLAAELVGKYEALMAYNGWLETHRAELRGLSSSERRAALWAARYATFGDDANQIWAMELKHQHIRHALASLDGMQGAGLDEKLSTYRQAIHAAYGEQAMDFMQSRQTELTNNFLAVDSVQDQLHAMPDAERAAALREIRRSMGMSPAAVERWSALDRRRDQRWSDGQAYMQERDRIMREYRDEEQARELARLREERFGEDAETIRAEEEAGFYRYANRRRYGRE